MLRDRHWHRLLHSARQRLHAGLWNLRLSCFPSFDTWQVIGISHKPGVGQAFLVKYRTWNQRAAEDSLITQSFWRLLRLPISPRIQRSSRPLAAEQATQIFNALSDIRVPAPPDDGQGVLDGTQCELSYFACDSSMRYRWTYNHPREWSQLEQFWESTWKTLAAVLKIPDSELPLCRQNIRTASTC